MWAWAGRAEMVDADAGLRAGGALLLLSGLAVLARQTKSMDWKPPTLHGVLAGLGGGALLVGLQQLPGAMTLATGLTALVVVAGQELWFRGVLQRQVGWLWSVVLWVVIVGPGAPLHAAVAGLLLSWLSRCYGLFAAIMAAGLWRLLG